VTHDEAEGGQARLDDVSKLHATLYLIISQHHRNTLASISFHEGWTEAALED